LRPLVKVCFSLLSPPMASPMAGTLPPLLLFPPPAIERIDRCLAFFFFSRRASNRLLYFFSRKRSPKPKRDGRAYLFPFFSPPKLTNKSKGAFPLFFSSRRRAPDSTASPSFFSCVVYMGSESPPLFCPSRAEVRAVLFFFFFVFFPFLSDERADPFFTAFPRRTLPFPVSPHRPRFPILGEEIAEKTSLPPPFSPHRRRTPHGELND